MGRGRVLSGDPHLVRDSESIELIHEEKNWGLWALSYSDNHESHIMLHYQCPHISEDTDNNFVLRVDVDGEVKVGKVTLEYQRPGRGHKSCWYCEAPYPNKLYTLKAMLGVSRDNR